MRVIAGKYKGRILKSPEGDSTRPTIDRVKEALFSILGDDLINASVLDLFAGTGALGIEALSRGARYVIFNDYRKKAGDLIAANLRALQINDGYKLYRADYRLLLKELKNTAAKFDIVFLDPPYANNVLQEVVSTLDENDNLASPCVICSESLKTSANEELNGFTRREYDFGTVKLNIYRR